MKTAIKLVLIYFLIQILGAIIAGPFCLLYTYLADGALNMDKAGKIALAPAMLLGFVLMTFYLWYKKYLTGDRNLYSFISVPFLLWSLLAGLSAIALIGILNSVLSFLPDWLDQTFNLLQSGWLGIFCIAVLGPILEELLFRGAITKVLLSKYTPVKAILISGLIFGIFHINPAQVVTACILGFLLAWLYYKTRSVIPCIVIHILNNSLAVYLNLAHPEFEELPSVFENPELLIGIVVLAPLLYYSLKKLNQFKTI